MLNSEGRTTYKNFTTHYITAQRKVTEDNSLFTITFSDY